MLDYRLKQETVYKYFGARYYDPGISIWLSVDPLSDLFPGYSPYNYALNNPLRLIDPNGMGPVIPPNGETTNAGEGYQATQDGKYLYGEGLRTKVWNPELDYGPGSGSSGKGGFEDYKGEPIDFSNYGGNNPQGQGGCNQWNYNEAAAFGIAAAGSTSNLIGTAATYTAYEMRALSAAKAAKAGVNAVKSVSTGAGIFGGILTVAIAGYEIKTGHANTHTFFDVGASALVFAALGASVIVGAPAIAVGAAVGGLVYGINSAIWMGTAIDKTSGNWGKNVIYGK